MQIWHEKNYYYNYYYSDPLVTLKRIPATLIWVATLGLGTTAVEASLAQLS